MINSWTEKVQPLYLGTAGCLVFDLWRVESSGIYDAMFKSETSLVTHRISLDSWLATSPTCLTSVAWLFKGIVRVFWGALPKTRICSSGQKLSMVHACIKKGTYGMSLWSRIPTCPSLLLTPLYLLSLSKSLWGKKKKPMRTHFVETGPFQIPELVWTMQAYLQKWQNMWKSQ